MLDDHERKVLRDIQRRLAFDDPNFEESFRALESPAAARRGELRPAYTAVIIVAGLLAVVMLLAGSAGGALAFAIVATAVWCARHFLTVDATPD